MKKKFYILLFLPFFGFAVLAQNFGSDPSGNGDVKKPVIDNINADAVITSGNEDYQIKYNKIDGAHTTNNPNTPTPSIVSASFKQGVDIGDLVEKEPLIEVIKREVKIYPVPAVNNLNIDFGRTIDVEVSLLNIIGQEMFSFKGQTRDLVIEVSEMPKGSYFLSIRIDKDLIVRRVEITE